MSEQKKEIVLDILKRLFGNPKKDFLNQEQYEFNCPSSVCKNDKNKFNLNFNSSKIIFHCFKCGYHGALHALVQHYGTQEDINRVNLLYPKSAHKIYKKPLFEDFDEHFTCELPKEYLPLNKKSNSSLYKKAIDYLKSRGITDDIIKKYELGYTESGDRKFRIVCPSRNSKGEINYYDARSFFPKSKRPYMKPDSPEKLSIIFNEYNINFDLPVYLVEGVFDMFPMPNCIPLLGKDLSPFLISKLIKHNTKVILCLDEDATKDTIRLYQELSSYGLDVYIVDVKNDIAKFFELHGKKKLIELLKTYKKPDFSYLFKRQLNNKKQNKKINTEQTALELKQIKQQIQEEENEQQ